ncbi:hypothetical protein SHIRM173S_09209 [Streptomyces hirsutus]
MGWTEDCGSSRRRLWYPARRGVAIRTRLRRLTAADEEVLRRVGVRLGTLACRDLKTRCHDGLEHDAKAWAARKRDGTPASYGPLGGCDHQGDA